MNGLAMTAAMLTAALALTACADEPGDPGAGGDYSECGELKNNQMVTCDSILRAVEGLCGFNLTIDPCLCAARVENCVGDVDWLEKIIDCEGGSADCFGYIDCLREAGDGPSGCANPVSWNCIVTKTAEG